MPPKPKYTKEEIIAAAYELTREKGIDAVVAREVGKRLNTSSSPIFTIWSSMDELREEVRKLAKEKYRQYMDDIFDYSPSFKEFGMRCVSFAAEEPNLFRLLFLSQREEHSPYVRFKQEFEVIFIPLVEEIINQLCIGIVLTDKLRDGSIDLDTAKELAHFYDFETMPKKKSI